MSGDPTTHCTGWNGATTTPSAAHPGGGGGGGILAFSAPERTATPAGASVSFPSSADECRPAITARAALWNISQRVARRTIVTAIITITTTTTTITWYLSLIAARRFLVCAALGHYSFRPFHRLAVAALRFVIRTTLNPSTWYRAHGRIELYAPSPSPPGHSILPGFVLEFNSRQTSRIYVRPPHAAPFDNYCNMSDYEGNSDRKFMH